MLHIWMIWKTNKWDSIYLHELLLRQRIDSLRGILDCLQEYKKYKCSPTALYIEIGNEIRKTLEIWEYSK